jgi:putative peptide zinc metalloprotease protein
MNSYKQDAVVDVRPFTQQRDGDEVIIGLPEAGVFFVVEPEAAEMLQELASGKNVGEVLETYQRKHGEKPDLDDFLTLLEAKGLIGAPGQSSFADRERLETQDESRRHYHFSTFPESIARLLFGKPALIIAISLIVWAIAAVISDHTLAPVPANLVFKDHLTLTWTILVILNVSAVFIHEMAHVIAARAAGAQSRIGIGNRLWYLVAETDMTGLWALPKRKRYVPFLAGMLCDGVCASLLILLLSSQHADLVARYPFLARLMRAMTFTYFMAIVWQFFLFVRTDLYFVLATALNCRNLLADTEVFLKNQLARFTSRIGPQDQSHIPPSERKVIRCYSGVWIAGRVCAILTALWATIPVSVGYWHILSSVISQGYQANRTGFVDGIVLTLYFLVPTVAGCVLWVRSFAHGARS